MDWCGVMWHVLNVGMRILKGLINSHKDQQIPLFFIRIEWAVLEEIEGTIFFNYKRPVRL